MTLVSGSWAAVGVAVPALVITGAAMMGRHPPRTTAARFAFTAAALILTARLGWWLAFEAQRVAVGARVLVALTIVGVSTAWWITAVNWTRR